MQTVIPSFRDATKQSTFYIHIYSESQSLYSGKHETGSVFLFVRVCETKKNARIESKLNAKRESWIWLNEEWTCFIYTITRCSVIYTYRLVMINMQQYDLIQHFIQNIKWSLIFRLILVLSLCACVYVCKINRTHRDVRTIKSSFFLFNDQTKNNNCFVFAHCFRLTHMPPIFALSERKLVAHRSNITKIST